MSRPLPEPLELPDYFRDPALLAQVMKTKAGRRRAHEFIEHAERAYAVTAKNLEVCAESIRLMRQALGEVKA